jgi:hypothetical protein
MSQVETTRVAAVDDRDNDGEKKPKNRRPASAEPPRLYLSVTNPYLKIYMCLLAVFP